MDFVALDNDVGKKETELELANMYSKMINFKRRYSDKFEHAYNLDHFNLKVQLSEPNNDIEYVAFPCPIDKIYTNYKRTIRKDIFYYLHLLFPKLFKAR